MKKIILLSIVLFSVLCAKAGEGDELIHLNAGFLFQSTLNVSLGWEKELAYDNAIEFFGEAGDRWTKDPEYNLMFVRRMQDYANDKLKSEGYLFLNDVYEMFGFPRSKFAKGIGWLYDEAHPEQNYVDFGIYDLSDPMRADFVNGYERTVWLDFNVHGSILNLV